MRARLAVRDVRCANGRNHIWDDAVRRQDCRRQDDAVIAAMAVMHKKETWSPGLPEWMRKTHVARTASGCDKPGCRMPKLVHSRITSGL